METIKDTESSQTEGEDRLTASLEEARMNVLHTHRECADKKRAGAPSSVVAQYEQRVKEADRVYAGIAAELSQLTGKKIPDPYGITW